MKAHRALLVIVMLFGLPLAACADCYASASA